MSSRVHKERTQVKRNTRTEAHQDVRTKRERDRAAAEKAALDREMDDLIDEIDGVLEQNAEEFITAFVQKGGE